MQKVRITVLKKGMYNDLADAYLSEGRAVGPCPLLEVGDTFLFEGSAIMPKGFCPWAWIDIYRSVNALSAGGTYTPWNNQDHQQIICCTDGVRPVTFCLEALSES